MINENKSSYYPEIYPYKKGVYSPYNKLWAIKMNITVKRNKKMRLTIFYEKGVKAENPI